MLVYDVFDVISLILIRIGSSLIVHDFLGFVSFKNT